MQRRTFTTGAFFAFTASIIFAARKRFLNSEASTKVPEGHFSVGDTFNDTNRQEFMSSLDILEGSIPKELVGHAFIMGSILPEIHDDKTSIIAGDGMFYRIDFANGSAVWNQKLIFTDSMIGLTGIEKAQFKNKEKYRFKSGGIARFNSLLGSINACNTAFVDLEDGTFVATYDAGRPWLMDPKNLKMKSPIGHNSEWQGVLPELLNKGISLASGAWPFPLIQAAAHPVFEPNEGCLYTVNYGGALNVNGFTKIFIRPFESPYLKIIRWQKNKPDQNLKTWKVVTRGNFGSKRNVKVDQLIHTIALTESYLIIGDSPFQLEVEMLQGGNFKERKQPNETSLWIIDRESLTDDATEVFARPIKLGGQYPHFFANYLNPSGEITLFGLETRTDPTIVVKDPGPLKGVITSPYDLGSIDRIVLRLESVEARSFTLDETKCKSFVSPDHTYYNALFAFEGNNYRNSHKECFFINLGFRPELYTSDLANLYEKDSLHRRVAVRDLPFNNGKGTLNTLFNLDLESMELKDSYMFPEGVVVLSQLVMRPDASHRRYLSVVVNLSPRDQIWIFDADNLRNGPLAKLSHSELRLGFSLHTAFLSKLEEYREPYQINITEELSSALDALKIPEDDKNELKVAIFPLMEKEFLEQ